MPTATSISGYSLLNNGALTTTFTAPASCSTPFDIGIGPVTDPTDLQWGAQCAALPAADCNPSGSVIRSIFSAAEGGDPSAGNIMVYHSPGLVCPAGWATVGAAAKFNPTSTSISGAFSQSDATPQFLGLLLDAIDPGETAVLCCPSSYTTIEGACYSTLPKSVFTPTGGCKQVLVDTATSLLSTVTTSFAPSEATSYVGVAISDMFTLIHQASDAAEASTASGTGVSASSTSKKSAALRVRGDVKGLGVAAVYCLALAVGAFLVV
ncbi:hypothetical protein EDB80DRAFT_735305 [Ilyonectria destructans]|nr:hypothetical protein EDB80DRAFT_735305 [Ilyonectria destructans]